MTSHVVSLPLVWETPLRTGNLRDPNGPQTTFASECFIDELAAAANADPLDFRMKLLTASTADDSGSSARARLPWSRPRPRSSAGSGVRRRSASAAATSSPGAASPTRIRSQTIVAQIAEVEVNRAPGTSG